MRHPNPIACIALLLVTASCYEPWAQDDGHCEEGDLDTSVTIRFEQIGAWTGEVVEWRLLGGCELAGTSDFTVHDDDREMEILETGDDVDVSLEAWIDLDGDAAYDAPPIDASWRVIARLDSSHETIELRAASMAQVDLGGW